MNHYLVINLVCFIVKIKKNYFFLDRETIVSNPKVGTLQETHLLRNEGVRGIYYTEEHCSSVIKSYVTNSPPKFKQVLFIY